MTRKTALDPRIAAFGAGLAAIVLARARYLRWGATAEERHLVLPGDELISRSDLTATRAITVEAAPEQVWPWLAQLGQGRGGFYTYDALENLVGCDIHSAGRIVPEWQHVQVGDEVRLHPDGGMVVAVLQPQRALVLRGGPPMGGGPSPFDFTWAFVLAGQPNGSTRLLVRERYAYTKRWAVLMVEPVEVVSFVMSRKMLRGIKERAERPTLTPAQT